MQSVGACLCVLDVVWRGLDVCATPLDVASPEEEGEEISESMFMRGDDRARRSPSQEIASSLSKPGSIDRRLA